MSFTDTFTSSFENSSEKQEKIKKNPKKFPNCQGRLLNRPTPENRYLHADVNLYICFKLRLHKQLKFRHNFSSSRYNIWKFFSLVQTAICLKIAGNKWPQLINFFQINVFLWITSVKYFDDTCTSSYQIHLHHRLVVMKLYLHARRKMDFQTTSEAVIVLGKL